MTRDSTLCPVLSRSGRWGPTKLDITRSQGKKGDSHSVTYGRDVTVRAAFLSFQKQADTRKEMRVMRMVETGVVWLQPATAISPAGMGRAGGRWPAELGWREASQGSGVRAKRLGKSGLPSPRAVL